MGLRHRFDISDRVKIDGVKITRGNCTCIDNATYKVSRSLVYWFWRRRFFKVFTKYGHGGHVGHVTQTI